MSKKYDKLKNISEANRKLEENFIIEQSTKILPKEWGKSIGLFKTELKSVDEIVAFLKADRNLLNHLESWVKKAKMEKNEEALTTLVANVTNSFATRFKENYPNAKPSDISKMTLDSTKNLLNAFAKTQGKESFEVIKNEIKGGVKNITSNDPYKSLRNVGDIAWGNTIGLFELESKSIDEIIKILNSNGTLNQHLKGWLKNAEMRKSEEVLDMLTSNINKTFFDYFKQKNPNASTSEIFNMVADNTENLLNAFAKTQGKQNWQTLRNEIKGGVKNITSTDPNVNIKYDYK